ncbi:MAG: hypothetical protein IH969_09070 [Candidatus Krumholzibacteriota bacterium]|nr:hypothetical protein [Candidatus Krumholzibacteriota bacterium]
MGSLKAILIAMGVGALIGAGVYHFALCKRTVTEIAPVTITAPPSQTFAPYTVTIRGEDRTFETREELDAWTEDLRWRANRVPDIVTKTVVKRDTIQAEPDTVVIDPSCPCQIAGARFRRDLDWSVRIDIPDKRIVASGNLEISTWIEQPDFMFHANMVVGEVTVRTPAFEIRDQESRLPSWKTVGEWGLVFGLGVWAGSR